MTKGAGIHCELSSGNDAEIFLAMRVHLINDFSFHKKVKAHDRCFNCAFNNYFNNVELCYNASQKSPFLIIANAPIKEGVELSDRCRNDE